MENNNFETLLNVALENNSYIKKLENENSKLNEKINILNNKLELLYFSNQISDDERKKRFTEIYVKKMWGRTKEIKEETASGSGSTLEATEILRNNLIILLKKYNIKTFLDAPCGDMNWMKLLLNNFEKYIGVDIVPNIIEDNKNKIKHDNVSFFCVDLLKGDLYDVDMIFNRACTRHLSNIEVQMIINNIKRTNSKFLLTDTSISVKYNDRTKSKYSEAKFLNLELPPFNFPKPIEYINTDKSGVDMMGLWKISDIPNQTF